MEKMPDKKAAQLLADATEHMAGDPTEMHRRADEFLCELLRSLGYDETAYLFETMEKWYS